MRETGSAMIPRGLGPLLSSFGYLAAYVSVSCAFLIYTPEFDLELG